ncbi:MAG: 16S rRNA (guanine(527)-N(7))-methyltransferase RsmG [Firmicutes bacterium]|nr:16S rRNA (guanine(527)-N(7))-methyltransferase RsmG [Bacillota bacterium]
MNIDLFIEELKKINIEVTEHELYDLKIFKDMLIEYNGKFNLTAIKTDEEIYLKHFYDSLTITKVIDLDKELNILDIGTGAGFPGLVLKIFFPKLNIILLDSNNKKITFLNEVIKILKLENIKCIHGRAEELSDTYREYFDIVTSRAVSNLRVLSELSIPYVKVNGYFIAMKGNALEEINEAKTTIKKLSSEIIKIEEFILPIEKSTRNIIAVEKKEKTPTNYPRRYDQILKKTLK